MKSHLQLLSITFSVTVTVRPRPTVTVLVLDLVLSNYNHHVDYFVAVGGRLREGEGGIDVNY